MSAMTSPEDERLARHFMAQAMTVKGRHPVTATAVFQFGAAAVHATVRDGAVTSVALLRDLRPLQAWDFSIKGDAGAWQDFWQAVPAPGCHDVFALMRHGRMAIEGNMRVLMTHLQFFKDLASAGREQA